MMRAHLEDRPKRLGAFVVVPIELERVIERCLEKAPARRFSSAAGAGEGDPRDLSAPRPGGARARDPERASRSHRGAAMTARATSCEDAELDACRRIGSADRRARPPPSVRSLVVGQRVGDTPYVVVGAIGQGGMGEVYEVEHAALGRRCVLKVLHRNHRGRDDLAARMREEARSLAHLRHPNLVDVFDLGVTADGRPYFAMELLRGRDLRKELARRGSIAPALAVDLDDPSARRPLRRARSGDRASRREAREPVPLRGRRR